MAGRSPEPISLLANQLNTVKVCRGDAEFVANVLGYHFLDEFLQTCNVFEFKGYSVQDMDSFINDVCYVIGNNDQEVRRKCQCVRHCQNFDYKIRQFKFWDDNNNGIMNFGLLVVLRSGEVLNAACCVLSLKFRVAKERVTTTTKTYLFGHEIISSSETWTEPNKLGFLTKESLLNFGWLKALEELKLRGIIANIKEVPTIGATQLSLRD